MSLLQKGFSTKVIISEGTVMRRPRDPDDITLRAVDVEAACILLRLRQQDMYEAKAARDEQEKLAAMQSWLYGKKYASSVEVEAACILMQFKQNGISQAEFRYLRSVNPTLHECGDDIIETKTKAETCAAPLYHVTEQLSETIVEDSLSKLQEKDNKEARQNTDISSRGEALIPNIKPFKDVYVHLVRMKQGYESFTAPNENLKKPLPRQDLRISNSRNNWHTLYIIETSPNIKCTLCEAKCQTKMYACDSCVMNVCRECIEHRLQKEQQDPQTFPFTLLGTKRHAGLKFAYLARNAVAAGSGKEQTSWSGKILWDAGSGHGRVEAVIALQIWPNFRGKDLKSTNATNMQDTDENVIDLNNNVVAQLAVRARNLARIQPLQLPATPPSQSATTSSTTNTVYPSPDRASSITPLMLPPRLHSPFQFPITSICYGAQYCNEFSDTDSSRTIRESDSGEYSG